MFCWDCCSTSDSTNKYHLPLAIFARESRRVDVFPYIESPRGDTFVELFKFVAKCRAVVALLCYNIGTNDKHAAAAQQCYRPPHVLLVTARTLTDPELLQWFSHSSNCIIKSHNVLQSKVTPIHFFIIMFKKSTRQRKTRNLLLQRQNESMGDRLPGA